MNKDILMLFVVSLLVASVLFVVTSNKSVTGNVAADLNQELGTYSLDPSYKVNYNYNLAEEYENAVQTARNIVEECKDRNNIGRCLNEMLEPDFVCEKNDLDNIFYDFVDKYKECLSLEDDVVCRLSLEDIEVDDQFKKKYVLGV